MIQTGITLNSTVKFITNYLAIILIIPAAIGGLWQLLELFNISLTFIRFFSISQIVPDGLLVLLLLLLGTGSYVFGVYSSHLFNYTNDQNQVEQLSPEQYEVHCKKEFKTNKIEFLFAFILITLYYSYVILKGSFAFIDVRSEIAFTCVIIVSLNSSLETCFYYAKGKMKGKVKKANILLLALYVLIAFYLFKRMHTTFIYANNIENVSNLKIKVAKLHPNTKQELLYFNDKYIFFKIITLPKKQIKGKAIKKVDDKIYIMELNELFIE